MKYMLIVSLAERISVERETKMPFMHGNMPLRRTFFYLQQGKIKFRDNVAVRSNSSKACSFLFELLLFG